MASAGSAHILVESGRSGEYRVTVDEGRSRTVHTVRVNEDEQRRYGGGGATERLLEESFRFLLEREPKESILQRFELSLIERYFPEYADEIRERMR